MRKNNNVYELNKYEKCNEETKALLNDYLKECRANRLTKKTLEQYKYIAKYVTCLLYDHFENKSILEMTRTDFRDLMIVLQDDFELSNARINTITTILKQALNYAEDNEDKWEFYEKNQARKIKKLAKKPVRKKIFLTHSEIKGLIHRLVANWRYQEAVLVSLAYDSGARVGELVQIKKEGLLNGNFTNEITRKGQKKKVRLIYLNDTKALIEKWLMLRGEDDVEELFISPIQPLNGGKAIKKPVRTQTLYYRITMLEKVIGKKLSPHVFRRSRAEALKRGEDERFNYKKFSTREIQVLLGHSDLNTTQIYLKDDSEEIMNNMIDFVNE